MPNNIGVYFSSGGIGATGYTCFDFGTSVLSKTGGTLVTADTYASIADSGAKIKIFRFTAPNVILIGEKAVSLSAGENIGIVVNIPWVQNGDLIGFYFSVAQPLSTAYAGSSLFYKFGDIGGTSDISTWTGFSANAFSIAGYVDPKDGWLQTCYPNQFLSKDEIVGY